MIAYASRTGTKRNLAALRRAGWRLMVSATGSLRSEGFPYALDNGAWTAHQNGTPFDSERFRVALRLLGKRADFVVLPDIVAGGLESLILSLSWLEEVQAHSAKILIPVQDGMLQADVAGLLSPDIGIFVGGSTEWKLNTLAEWAALAREHWTWVHVGRVNSSRRIYQCTAAGVNSFDGSGPSRFAKALPRLDGARRQRDLFAART